MQKPSCRRECGPRCRLRSSNLLTRWMWRSLSRGSSPSTHRGQSTDSGTGGFDKNAPSTKPRSRSGAPSRSQRDRANAQRPLLVEYPAADRDDQTRLNHDCLTLLGESLLPSTCHARCSDRRKPRGSVRRRAQRNLESRCSCPAARMHRTRSTLSAGRTLSVSHHCPGTWLTRMQWSAVKPGCCCCCCFRTKTGLPQTSLVA